MITVYLHTNLATSLSYVGVTSLTVEQRWRQHVSAARRGSRLAFHTAIRAHLNASSWTHGLLEVAVDRRAALLAEARWIRQLSTRTPRGYNMTAGGDGIVGLRRSESTREKLRKARLGRRLSPEMKRKISDAGLGRRHSACTRARMSERRRGRGNPFFGRRHSLEARHRIGEVSRNRSPETREKLRQARLGKHAHPQQVAKVSKRVIQATIDGVFVAEHASISAASRATSVNVSNICQCARDSPQHRTAGGFVWRYADDGIL